MVDIKPSSEAQKAAKKMQKEGWKSQDKKTMPEQIELGYQLALTPVEGEISAASSRYVLATSVENASQEMIARSKAEASCLSQIAQTLKTEISALVEREINNQQLSLTEAETQERLKQSVEATSKAHLKKCFLVWQFIRKESNGTYSVQMMMAFDRKVLNNNQ